MSILTHGVRRPLGRWRATGMWRVAVALCLLLLAGGAWPRVVWAQAAPAGAAAPPRLVRSQTDVYVIAGGKRRLVTSPQVFADYRFRGEWVEQIPEDELTRFPLGADLVAGPLLRAPDGQFWVVYHGSRRAIAGPDALGPLNLSAGDAVPADEATLRSYPVGRPVGNPRRPWLLVAPLSLAGAGLWLWWRRQARWPAVWALAAAATLLKLDFVSLYPWVHDGADADSYELAARFLMAGGSLLSDGPQGVLTWATSPLYPMVLAGSSGVASLFRNTVVGWKVLQVMVAAGLVPLTGDLARRVYGDRAGAMAATLAALSPLWFYSAELLQYEIWLAALLLLGTWCLVRGGASGPRRPWWLAAAGLWYGLAVVMQLKVVLLLVPAGVYALAQLAPAGAWLARTQNGRARGWTGPLLGAVPSPGLWPALGQAAAFGALALLPLGGWAARNLAVHHELVLGSRASGVIFWMGNHPAATGGIMQVPRPDGFYEYLRRYPERSPTAETRAFTDMAWDYIRREPSRAALLALTKLERFWWTITPDRLGAYIEARTVAFLGGAVDAPAVVLFSKLVQVSTVLLAAAGALWGGRVRAARSSTWDESPAQAGYAPRAGQAARWLLLGSIIAFWLVHAPFISEPRYRIPIAPLLHVFEAAGLVWLRDALDVRRRRFLAESPLAPPLPDVGGNGPVRGGVAGGRVVVHRRR